MYIIYVTVRERERHLLSKIDKLYISLIHTTLTLYLFHSCKISLNLLKELASNTLSVLKRTHKFRQICMHV